MNWFIAQPDISYALYLLFIALSILNKLPTKGNYMEFFLHKFNPSFQPNLLYYLQSDKITSFEN